MSFPSGAVNSSIPLSSQDAANLRALLHAYHDRDNGIELTEMQLKAEIYKMLTGKEVCEAAWAWANRALDAYDEDGDCDLLATEWPFNEDGDGVEGVLSDSILSKKNVGTGEKPINIEDDGPEEEEPSHNVLSGKLGQSVQHHDGFWRNPALRQLQSGKYQGTRPELPAPEGDLVFYAENHLKDKQDERNRFVRVITNVKFVNSYDEHVSVAGGVAPINTDGQPAVYMQGLVASGNLEWEMGQRAQAGFLWADKLTRERRFIELIWMKIPVESIQLVRGKWWRNGEEPVIAVWGQRAVYGVFGADLTYHHRFQACLHQRADKGVSRPVSFASNAVRPSWIDKDFWPGMKEDWARMAKGHAQNTRAPPVPEITRQETKALILAGKVASLEWKKRLKLEHQSGLEADMRSLDPPGRSRRKRAPSPDREAKRAKIREAIEEVELELEEISEKLENLKKRPQARRPPKRPVEPDVEAGDAGGAGVTGKAGATGPASSGASSDHIPSLPPDQGEASGFKVTPGATQSPPRSPDVADSHAAKSSSTSSPTGPEKAADGSSSDMAVGNNATDRPPSVAPVKDSSDGGAESTKLGSGAKGAGQAGAYSCAGSGSGAEVPNATRTIDPVPTSMLPVTPDLAVATSVGDASAKDPASPPAASSRAANPAKNPTITLSPLGDEPVGTQGTDRCQTEPNATQDSSLSRMDPSTSQMEEALGRTTPPYPEYATGAFGLDFNMIF